MDTRRYLYGYQKTFLIVIYREKIFLYHHVKTCEQRAVVVVIRNDVNLAKLFFFFMPEAGTA